MSGNVEDVWAIVHERDGLRRRVKQLEAENRRLRIIVAGHAKDGTMKPEDVSSPMPGQKWVLVPNPGWNAVPEEPFTQSACHDFSHFVTVQCACGKQMHMHQTQWERASEFEGIASKCHGCGKILKFPPSYFQGALAAMRESGWIA